MKFIVSEKCLLSEWHIDKVKDGINEARRLLAKELNFTEYLVNQERVKELWDQIEYLKDVLLGKCELSIFGRKGCE